MIFTNPKTRKEVKRDMKSTSTINLRKNIIGTGLLDKFPVALIYTAKGDFVGSVARNSPNGKFVQYIWQGDGNRKYRCMTDGTLAPVKKKDLKVKPKAVRKAAKVKKVKAQAIPMPKPKTTFGNAFLDEHIIIASIPKFKGRA